MAVAQGETLSRTNRRIEVDILKGIGIILVMFGHALPPGGFAQILIYGFHMPLFFFCSGMLYKDRPIFELAFKGLKTLMVPWVTFCFVLVVCAYILKIWSNGPGPQLNPLDEHCYVLYHTIWFLPCLYITKIIYRVLAIIRNEYVVAILCAGGYILAFLLNRNGVNIPLFIDTALGMLLFYHCGKYFMKKGLMDIKISIWFCIILILTYLVLILYIRPEVNLKDNIFPIYIIAVAIVPIYALYHLCRYFNCRFLAYCGMASIAILGLHHPLYDVVMFPIVNRIQLPQFIEVITVVGVSLFITLVMYQLMMKYTPFFLGRTKNVY